MENVTEKELMSFLEKRIEKLEKKLEHFKEYMETLMRTHEVAKVKLKKKDVLLFKKLILPDKNPGETTDSTVLSKE